MGVDNLLQCAFVKPYKRVLTLDEMTGKHYALDASAFLVLFMYGLGEHERNKFLMRAKNLIQLFRRYEINVVWVFDGKPAPWKSDEAKLRDAERKRKRDEKDDAEEKLEHHREKRSKLESKLNDMITEQTVVEEIQVKVLIDIIDSDRMEDDIEPGSISNDLIRIHLDVFSNFNVTTTAATSLTVNPDIEQEQKLIEMELKCLDAQIVQDEQTLKDKSRLYIEIRPEDRQLLRELLVLMKVPIINAEFEADYVFGSLARTNQIEGAFANDSDLLWHGCNLLYVKQLSELTRTEAVECFDVKAILKGLKCEQQTFMDMCFVIDTDYKASGLSGVGILSVVEEFFEHKTVDAIVENLCNKKQKAILALKKKNQNIEDNIAKTEEKIQELTNKKKPNAALIDKAQKRLEELQLKQMDQIPSNEAKIQDWNEKIKEYREYLIWYKDIIPKVLQKERDGTYKIQWNTFQKGEISMPDITAFLEKHCTSAFISN